MSIAFNTSTDGGNNGGVTNTLTFNHVVGSGTNRLLVVGFAGDTGSGVDDITGVTCGGVAMIFAKKQSPSAGGSRWIYQYYLLNPPSGTQSIAIASASAHWLLGLSADYSGVSQSGQPDAVESLSSVGAATSTLTSSITTVTNNDWAVLIEGGYDDNNPPSAGAGLVLRNWDHSFGTVALFDSGQDITPAGSYSMTTNRAGNSLSITHVAGAYAPAPLVVLPLVAPPRRNWLTRRGLG